MSPRRSSRGRSLPSIGPWRPKRARMRRRSCRGRRPELSDARKAIDAEDYTEARRLADQAEADATLAETRAQAAVEVC